MIAKHELPMLPVELHYCCQEKAWFDKKVLSWVEQILKPYFADAPHGIMPLLLLDNFKVHKMGVVI